MADPRISQALLHQSKHDADCLRRKEDPKMRYVCTCGLTDEQVRGPLNEGDVISADAVHLGFMFLQLQKTVKSAIVVLLGIELVLIAILVAVLTS